MKKVLITGANKGIGLETARQLLQQGYYVYVGSRDVKKGKAAADILKAEGLANVEAIQLDVTDEESVKNARIEIGKKTDVLDVLVNNVGNDNRQDIEKISAHDWHKCMQVNLDPAFFSAQAAYKIMNKNASGSIINFSSINALMGQQHMTGYSIEYTILFF